MSYDNWRKRLDIAQKYTTVAERRAALAPLRINFSQPNNGDEGYYRKPLTEKLPNGRNKVIGWVPVAYFLSDPSSADGIELCGTIGAGANQRNMTDAEIGDEELWSYVVANPISYEEYEHVADNGGRWSDEPLERAPAEIRADAAAVERVIERTDNLPPTVDPLTEFKESIANATGAALLDHKKVASNDQAALAEGAKNRIAELRLLADKAGKALYDPPYREYKRLHALWTPMLKMAQDAEDKLVMAVRVWRESERKRLLKEEEDRQQQAIEDEAAQQRAADRAIVAGEPEPEPAVPEPEPATSMPVEPPKPTYGTRTVKPTEKWQYDGVTDWAKVMEHYKDSTEVKALLTQLAQRDVKAGREIPGTNRHWGII